MTNNSGVEECIKVEVVLAMPDRQELKSMTVAPGTTVSQAVEQSSIAGLFEGFEVDFSKVGIFGQKVNQDQILREGDRVEIYRPLIADPKEVRRQRAQTQSELKSGK